MRSSDNLAKLGDVMLAKALEGTQTEQITRPGQMVGEVTYMSPERTRGASDIDCRSDIYSLGATLYALLTGRPPFEGDSLPDLISKVRNDKPVKPKEFQLSIADMFQDAVLKMLEKRPEDRYESPRAMLKDLERIVKSPMPPKEADVQEKSLTLMLLSIKPSDEEQKQQFQYLTDLIPKPTRLLREYCRGTGSGDNFVPQGPITFLHADRITDCSCEMGGDTATGTVSFEVPELYRGKVDYVAKRKDDSWQIQEFIMSAYDIHLVRSAEGKWENK